MKLKNLTLLLIGIIATALIVSNNTIYASDGYPTHTQTTDGNSITMTNSATWIDDTHANENYNANLDISINGLKDKKTFNEPVDVQIVHDISSSMDYTCYSDNHYTFKYYKKITEATSDQELPAFKTLIEEYLMNYLQGNEVTGKDNWIPIAGMTDKEGKLFSNDAYLVPMNSFYMKDDPNSLDVKVLNRADFETRWFVIDDPVASNSLSDNDNANYSYWHQRYHTLKSEHGSFHSLSATSDPTHAEYVYFAEFDRKAAIKADCKSYTATANKLIYNFSNQLFQANTDNHIAINGFTESNKYSGEFTNNPATLKQQLVNAFNSGSGQTNYEAGLVVGRDNLNTHQDNDGRKKILIFISDGRPNRSLDGDGNIVESANMERLKAIADEMKKEGTEIYTVGFCIDKYDNDTYLLPMATDQEHSQFRTPKQLDNMVEIYDFMQDKIIEDTYIRSIVENTISQYYTVDKDKLPEEVILIENQVQQEDGSVITVQKIRYNVYTEDLGANGINTKVIPLILKEEYRETNEYYPTNDETRNGANAIYENLNADKHNIAVKTPWLPVNAKAEQTYRIDTEVINGSILDSITDIKKGEDKVISYLPNNGYELKEIYIDDKLIDINDYINEYQFNDIAKNYKIKVVYEKITTDNPIDPDKPNNPEIPNTPNNKPNDMPNSDNETNLPNNTVQTGDQANLARLIITMFTALSCFIYVVVKKNTDRKSS